MSTPQKKKSSFGSDLYSGAAAVGKGVTFIGIFTGSILGIIFIIIGIVFIRKKQYYTGTTKANVLASTCSKHPVQNGEQYDCTLHVSYTVDHKQYKGTIVTKGDHPILKGSVVTIQYNPKLPTQIRAKQISSKTVGWILIGVALFIILGSWLSYWAARKYKGFAAFEGGAAVLGTAKNIF